MSEFQNAVFEVDSTGSTDVQWNWTIPVDTSGATEPAFQVQDPAVPGVWHSPLADSIGPQTGTTASVYGYAVVVAAGWLWRVNGLVTTMSAPVVDSGQSGLVV